MRFRSIASPLVALVVAVGVLPATAASLYVTNTRGDSISVIDTNTFEVAATIPLGSGKPNRVAFHPDGKTAWVVYDKSHDLGVVDAESGKRLKRVKIGGNPYNLNFTPDGRYLGGGDAMGLAMSADGRVRRAAAGENKAVLKIDTATNKPTTSVALPGVVHEATLTVDGRYLYTTLRKVNKLVVIDTTTDRIVAIVPQKGYPDLVTMEPTGRYALVTNRYADLVAVIDLKTHAQVRTIGVGKAPHGMALRPQ